MPGEEKNQIDIIDQALAADDTDYGDSQSQDDGGDSGQEEQSSTSLQTTETQPSREQTPAQVPGRVPDTRQQGQPPQGLRRVGAEFADQRGNIVDKTGKVIAPAGAPARWWQEASRATAQVRQMTQRMQNMERQLQQNNALIQQAKEIAELPQKLGISRNDYNEGIALMQHWTSDPVKVAREVVARAMSFGHNITDILGKNVGDAIDTRAVSMAIERATGPLLQQQQETRQQAEIRTRASSAYENFRATHEYADVHGEAIAHLMKQGQSPEQAYLQLENFALRNGLDFSQPLGQQVAGPAPVNGHVQTGVRQPAPMVPGHRGSSEQLTSQSTYADAGDSWTDILSSVMREQG